MKGISQISSGVRELISGVSSFVRSIFDCREALLCLEGRDWQVGFGPIEGKAGESKEIIVTPQCRFFRGEKVMATDTASPAGTGTRISNVAIGLKLQRPVGSCATLTAFFASNALGNGIKWDICDRWDRISITVHFIEDCKFDMTVFGKAVL